MAYVKDEESTIDVGAVAAASTHLYTFTLYVSHMKDVRVWRVAAEKWVIIYKLSSRQRRLQT